MLSFLPLPLFFCLLFPRGICFHPFLAHAKLIHILETAMLHNRSVPPSTIIPVLNYPDVNAAAVWLCAAFGFRIRLRIGDHRIQLKMGEAASEGNLVVGEGTVSTDVSHSTMIRVPDANAHCEQAREHGATILKPPTDHPYGERQYNAQDFAGHRWTFTQSIADIAPEDWGGESVDL